MLHFIATDNYELVFPAHFGFPLLFNDPISCCWVSYWEGIMLIKVLRGSFLFSPSLSYAYLNFLGCQSLRFNEVPFYMMMMMKHTELPEYFPLFFFSFLFCLFFSFFKIPCWYAWISSFFLFLFFRRETGFVCMYVQKKLCRRTEG